MEKFNALRCVQNGKEFFLSVIPSSVLRECCFVIRREDDSKKGFQRSLNEARAKDIAYYLDNMKGVIPSAIILSAQSVAKLSFVDNENALQFNPVSNSFMILDGQHRLYGFMKSDNEYQVPVVVFNSLKQKEEVGLFIDINTNQKGVPTTLLLDIKNMSGSETTKEEKQREIFDRLNKDSVMAGYFSPTKSQTGKITRVTFNKATVHIFDSGVLAGQTTDVIYNTLKNYLDAVERVFVLSKSANAKLTNSTFFKASFEIFNDVIQRTIDRHSNIKVESIADVIEPLATLNFENYTGTSNATLNKVVGDFKKAINPKIRMIIDEGMNNIF